MARWITAFACSAVALGGAVRAEHRLRREASEHVDDRDVFASVGALLHEAAYRLIVGRTHWVQRHSYVTRSLSRGVPEDTVRLHAAHESNELHRYREFANSIAQLKLDDLTPLHETSPELVGWARGWGQAEKRSTLPRPRVPK